MKLRTGRKVGKTVYIQVDEDPADSDVLVGYFDNIALANIVVSGFNKAQMLPPWDHSVERDKQSIIDNEKLERAVVGLSRIVSFLNHGEIQRALEEGQAALNVIGTT